MVSDDTDTTTVCGVVPADWREEIDTYLESSQSRSEWVAEAVGEKLDEERRAHVTNQDMLTHTPAPTVLSVGFLGASLLFALLALLIVGLSTFSYLTGGPNGLEEIVGGTGILLFATLFAAPGLYLRRYARNTTADALRNIRHRDAQDTEPDADTTTS